MGDHQCFACDEDNPLRIVKSNGENWTFDFVERLVGPRGRAHGGTAVGALTCPALQLAQEDDMEHPVALHVTGRLNLPVPLAEPIGVTAQRDEDRYRFELRNDSTVYLTGSVKIADQRVRPGSVLQVPPPEKKEDLQALAELADADLGGPTLRSEFLRKVNEAGTPWEPPICFGCAESETALKLHNRIAKPGHLWTRWETEPSFTDGDGRLAATMVVAALDCSLLWVEYAIDPDLGVGLARQRKIWMTGTYGVQFLRVPPVDIDGGYRVATRHLRRDGRKSFNMSALLDRQGTVYAIGEAVAILIDLPEGWTP
jgi:hypothetical protein